MRKVFRVILLICVLIQPVSATSIIAPEVPESGRRLMPEASTFSEGLWMIAEDLIPLIKPDLNEAAQVSAALIVTAILTATLGSVSNGSKMLSDMVGATTISIVLLTSSNSMIQLASEIILEMTTYGSLLIPVMTTAVAAQGGMSTSAALYTGFAVFNTILYTVISKLMIPFVYVYLAISTASSVLGDDLLNQLQKVIYNMITWCLKTLLTIFTMYMSITGLVSGTTDGFISKAAKSTISTVVPIVGKIISDASSAVLLGVGMAKNTAGVYGMLALLATFLGPFLKISCHYILLKGTSIVCALFGSKQTADGIESFSNAMRLLLGMTGAVCILILISVISFLKGAN